MAEGPRNKQLINTFDNGVIANALVELNGSAQYPAADGSLITNIPGVSGSHGSVTVDFGAFPGAPEASVAITGQTGILAASNVSTWISPVATTDHSADEQAYENIELVAYNISVGVGFTIRARPRNFAYANPKPYQNLLYGKFNVAWAWE